MTARLYHELNDTVYFWFAANDTSGSGGDGATPLADVRLAGAAASAIPTLSPTPVLLTHANFPPGCYEVAVAATSGNGFAADSTYAVFCTLAIDSQNPTGFVGSFTLSPVLANVQEWLDTAPNALVSSRVDVSVGAMAANVLTSSAVAANSIHNTALAANSVSEVAVSSVAAVKIRSVAYDVSDAAGTTTTLIDTVNRTEGNDDHWKGQLIHFRSGTSANVGQVRLITGFTASSDTITFAPPVNGATSSGDGYSIIPMSAVDVGFWNSVVPNALIGGAVDADVSAIQAGAVDATAIANAAFDAATFAAGAIDANALAADAAIEIADAILSRDVDNVEAAAPKHSLCVAILKSVSRIIDDAGTLKVYETDGTTLKLSQVVTTDASADPIDELGVGT